MPISSPRTASQTGFPADPFRSGPWAGRIALARGILAIEKLLPLLWPAFGFIGFYLALALTGIFAFIPWPLQALAAGRHHHRGRACRCMTGWRLSPGPAPSTPRGGWSVTAACRIARSPNMATAWWAPIPLPRNCGGCIRRGSLPARLAAGAAAHPPLPNAIRKGLRWYLLDRHCGRAGAGARRYRRAADLRPSTAALPPPPRIDAWVDPPPYTGLPLFSLHAGRRHRVACRRARC